MVEHFNDARVLRSDENILTLCELRLLLTNLESGDHTTKDLLTLAEISSKIDDALGDYGERCYAAIMTARRKSRELNTPEALGMIDQALGITLSKLDDEFGEELAPDIMFKISEWEWMKDRWTSNKRLRGDREIRHKLIRINDALTNAKGVKFVGKDKLAWVKGEPEPIHEAAS